MSGQYIYLWEYMVHKEYLSEFLEAYGSEGDWVRLFRGSSGYVQTELLRDRENPLRYITIDRWESVEAWQAFRTDKDAEFEALDKQCEQYTLSEKQIGLFLPS